MSCVRSCAALGCGAIHEVYGNVNRRQTERVFGLLIKVSETSVESALSELYLSVSQMLFCETSRFDRCMSVKHRCMSQEKDQVGIVRGRSYPR
jgi:hypothetical protein